MEIKDWIQNRGYRRSTIEQVYHFCKEKKHRENVLKDRARDYHLFSTKKEDVPGHTLQDEGVLAARI